MTKGNDVHLFVTDERGREVSTSQGGGKARRDKSVSREAFEMAVGSMGERLERLEHTTQELENYMFSKLEEVKQSASDLDSRFIRIEESVMGSIESLRGVIEGMQARFVAMEEDLAICKKAIANGGTNAAVVVSQVDFPKPSRFNGVRNAKEVENFLWEMELYFDNLKLLEETAKIKVASSYLADTAMLWWRRKHADIEKGACRIETWVEFKKELKRQFYPENVVYEARKKLRELRHKGTIRDYVEEFTTLILQIPVITDEEQLLCFIDGLQSWAKTELQRRCVKSVDEAIAVAESLTDFYIERPPDFESEEDIRNESDGEGQVLYRPFQPKGFKKDQRREEFEAKKSSFVPKGGCYMCKGPHLVKECPKLGSLSAMVEQHEAGTQEKTGKIGSLQLLNALMTNHVEKTKSKGLMYVEGTINGKSTQVMVDTGASHNFISIDEATRLGIKWSKKDGWMKAVNAKAQPVDGTAWGVKVQLRDWRGPVDFSVIPMDDFKVVLGLDFMRKVMAIPIPALNSLLIMERGSSCIIPTFDGSKDGKKHISAMQLTKAVEEVEPTFLTEIKVEDGHGIVEIIHQPIEVVLEENKNVISAKLSKRGKVESKQPARVLESLPISRGPQDLHGDEGVTEFGGGECHDPFLSDRFQGYSRDNGSRQGHFRPRRKLQNIFKGIKILEDILRDAEYLRRLQDPEDIPEVMRIAQDIQEIKNIRIISQEISEYRDNIKKIPEYRKVYQEEYHEDTRIS